MPIDFQLPPDVEEVRLRVRKFMDAEVRPAEATLQEREADRNSARSISVSSAISALPILRR